MAISSYIAASKLQENLVQNFNLNSNDTQFEQQIRKQQINLLSKKRFYDILESAEDYYKIKNGVLDFKYRTFKNKVYTNNLYDLNGEQSSYHLKTNNSIGKFSEHVNVHNEEGTIVLEFVINRENNPQSTYHTFDDLNYFYVVENAKTYSFNVIKFLGTNKINQYETSYYFQAIVEKNGVYDFEMDESERILDSKNTPPKDRYYL